MTDTAIIEGDVSVRNDIDAGRTPFSWSAAIAGALAATAVTFIIVSLGSGIGLSFASPYGSGPSATSLTVLAAVWLVMAQTMGFATGGYLAGRLRSPAHDGVIGETTFRDAAQGFMVWALGCGGHGGDCRLARPVRRWRNRASRDRRGGWHRRIRP
jgi:hypothetical protein